MNDLSFKTTGIIDHIYDEAQVTDKFKKREFSIRVDQEYNGATYSQYPKFQLSQSKCDLADNLKVGDMVTVSWNLRGMRNDKDGVARHFNNLEAWKIEKEGSIQDPQPAVSNHSSNNEDDMPF